MTHRYVTADQRSNQPSDSSAEADESSTNASKRRAGAASIVVVSSSASIDAADVEAESSEADAQSEDGRLVLVSLDDYRPGLTVRVVDRLPATTVVRLLRPPDGETVPVLTRPDEYTGYVARSTLEGGAVGTTTHLFARESLEIETDAEYELVADAQVFSTRLNLFRVTARRVDEE